MPRLCDVPAPTIIIVIHGRPEQEPIGAGAFRFEALHPNRKAPLARIRTNLVNGSVSPYPDIIKRDDARTVTP